MSKKSVITLLEEKLEKINFDKDIEKKKFNAKQFKEDAKQVRKTFKEEVNEDIPARRSYF